MQEEDLEVAIKVVVVGNGAVGKSSLIQRYCNGVFTSEYKKTIGVDFLERELQVGVEECRLMIWDTAGQEEFDAITKAYYRGAQVCVMVFSTVDRESFLALEKWKQKVDAEVSGAVMCVVQNKIDLIDEACMTSEEVDQMVKGLKLKLFRTSVKENFNVDQVFDYLARRYLAKRRDASSRQCPSITTPSKSHNIVNSAMTSSDNISTGNNGQSFQIKRDNHQQTKKNIKSCTVL